MGNKDNIKQQLDSKTIKTTLSLPEDLHIFLGSIKSVPKTRVLMLAIEKLLNSSNLGDNYRRCNVDLCNEIKKFLTGKFRDTIKEIDENANDEKIKYMQKVMFIGSLSEDLKKLKNLSNMDNVENIYETNYIYVKYIYPFFEALGYTDGNEKNWKLEMLKLKVNLNSLLIECINEFIEKK